jgi:MFS family permease
MDRITKYFVDPRRGMHKYLLQVLLCLFLSGPTFFDNFFNACTTDIIERLQISHEDYSLLISIPSITGVVCGVVAGLITMYGSTATATITAILSFCGAIIVCYGIDTASYSTVMAGRFVFVLFWNLLGSVQKVIIFRQFGGKALVWIFGLKVVAIRIGAVSGLYFSGSILSQMSGSLAGGFYCALLLSGISLVCTILFSYLRRGTPTARLVMPLLIGRRRDRATRATSDDSTPPGRGSYFSIPKESWLCCLVIFLYYGGIAPFETFGVDYLITDYGMSKIEAGQALALVPFFSFFSPLMAPILGTVRIQLISITAAQVLAAFGILAQVFEFPYSPMLYLCLIGIGHLVVANAVWLALAGVSPTETHKTNAVSISSAVYSMTAFTFNWATGAVRDASGDYAHAFIMLSLLVFSGGLAAMYLLMYGKWIEPSTQGEMARLLLDSDPSRGDATPEVVVLDTCSPVVDNHFAPST